MFYCLVKDKDQTKRKTKENKIRTPIHIYTLMYINALHASIDALYYNGA
jgi:hypothetical protein